MTAEERVALILGNQIMRIAVLETELEKREESAKKVLSLVRPSTDVQKPPRDGNSDPK